MEGAREFFEAVAHDFQQTNAVPKYDRDRPLIAVPILGTGGGGGGGYILIYP
jgi:hypothetical protein